MNEYFNFNKKDRNAILLLIAIIFIVALAKIFLLPLLQSKSTAVVIPSDLAFGENKKQSSKNDGDEIENDGQLSEKNISVSAIELNIHQSFNPNEFGFNDWKKIGLPEKFCKTISHYQEKGGKFKSAEDLKKIWGMKEEWFEQLAPFVKIEQLHKEDFATSNKTEIHHFVKRISIVELNSADSLQLDSLPLIGMKTANRIIKYRNLLGGFYAIEQLKEVWGLKDSVLLVNQNRFTLNTNLIRKININSATLDELKKHPYLHYAKANVLINFRKSHGKYSSIEDLKATKMFNDDELNKLKPYLVF